MTNYSRLDYNRLSVINYTPVDYNWSLTTCKLQDKEDRNSRLVYINFSMNTESHNNTTTTSDSTIIGHL